MNLGNLFNEDGSYNPDYIDMEMVNRLSARYEGYRNRTARPDPNFPLPAMVTVDRYSRCFVTRAAHVSKRNQAFCVACEKMMTEY